MDYLHERRISGLYTVKIVLAKVLLFIALLGWTILVLFMVDVIAFNCKLLSELMK